FQCYPQSVVLVCDEGVFRANDGNFEERISDGIHKAAPRAIFSRLKAPPVDGAAIIELDQFFSSRRRRHTRSTRDWSSDVCSSDLSMPRMRWTVIIHATSAPPRRRAVSVTGRDNTRMREG